MVGIEGGWYGEVANRPLGKQTLCQLSYSRSAGAGSAPVLEENTSRLGPEPPAKTVSIWIGSLDRGDQVCGSAPAFLAGSVRADSGKLVAPLAVRIPLGSEAPDRNR
jgi:hypothetical protein